MWLLNILLLMLLTSKHWLTGLKICLFKNLKSSVLLAPGHARIDRNQPCGSRNVFKEPVKHLTKIECELKHIINTFCIININVISVLIVGKTSNKSLLSYVYHTKWTHRLNLVFSFIWKCKRAIMLISNSSVEYTVLKYYTWNVLAPIHHLQWLL